MSKVKLLTNTIFYLSYWLFRSIIKHNIFFYFLDFLDFLLPPAIVNSHVRFVYNLQVLLTLIFLTKSRSKCGLLSLGFSNNTFSTLESCFLHVFICIFRFISHNIGSLKNTLLILHYVFFSITADAGQYTARRFVILFKKKKK